MGPDPSSRNRIAADPDVESAAEPSWDRLFAAEPPPAGSPPPDPALSGTAPGAVVAMRLLRKRGRPFLLLPDNPPLAAQCLELYPAQTARARLLKGLLRWFVGTGFRLGTEPVGVAVPSGSPLGHFLRTSSGLAASTWPSFGILAGNPATPGRRFTIIVFGERGHPTSVIKVGSGPRARQLIRQERDILKSVGGLLRGVPRLKAGFECGELSALALDYVPGRSPRPDALRDAVGLVFAWIQDTRPLPVRSIPGWQRLEEAAGTAHAFLSKAARLRDHEVRGVLYHGDFTPWNIRVSAEGHWTALDWERGENVGMPGWDCLHYLLQPAILVRRTNTSGLLAMLTDFTRSEAFQRYAQRVGIAGFEREVATTYLLYVTEVIRPSEGLEQARALLTAWCSNSPLAG